MTQRAIDQPRLDAEVLLAHALGKTRAQLHAHPQDQLNSTESDSYRQLIERRARHEPVAYIVGHQEFYGLDLFVDHRVLIPRPETELLVEKAIEVSQHQPADSERWLNSDLGRVAEGISRSAYRNQASGFVVADVGTGSGAIAVSLAVHLPGILVYATDSSPQALKIATRNCRRHGVDDRVRLLQGHLLEPLPQPVDLIVANLPYVSETEWHQLPPGIRRYEPREALHGGTDGLDHIRRLLAQAEGHLKPRGIILLEIGATQGAAVVALAKRHFPTARVDVTQDYAGLDRVVTLET